MLQPLCTALPQLHSPHLLRRKAPQTALALPAMLCSCPLGPAGHLTHLPHMMPMFDPLTDINRYLLIWLTAENAVGCLKVFPGIKEMNIRWTSVTNLEFRMSYSRFFFQSASPISIYCNLFLFLCLAPSLNMAYCVFLWMSSSHTLPHTHSLHVAAVCGLFLTSCSGSSLWAFPLNTHAHTHRHKYKITWTYAQSHVCQNIANTVKATHRIKLYKTHWSEWSVW